MDYTRSTVAVAANRQRRIYEPCPCTFVEGAQRLDHPSIHHSKRNVCFDLMRRVRAAISDKAMMRHIHCAHGRAFRDQEFVVRSSAVRTHNNTTAPLVREMQQSDCSSTLRRGGCEISYRSLGGPIGEPVRGITLALNPSLHSAENPFLQRAKA